MTTRVLFVGPFPPPIHGQASSTEWLFRRLSAERIDLISVDTNSGQSHLLGRTVQKLARHQRAARLIAGPVSGPLYLSLNANQGMILTLVLVLLARLRGRQIFLHHHTYDHLATARGMMKLIGSTAGKHCLHICICEAMSARLRAVYRSVVRTTSLSNVGVVDPELRRLPVMSKARPAVLGHLGNLTEEKGIGRAIAAFRAARYSGLAEKLILAGPCADAYARKVVRESAVEFGNDVEYLGPVYGKKKVEFFSSIDIFLFPSLYNNETQGIVNLEALAAGVPVIAYGLCCVPSDLVGMGCRVVDPSDCFVDACIDYLGALTLNYDSAVSAARGRFDTLLLLHEMQVAKIRELLSDR